MNKYITMIVLLCTLCINSLVTAAPPEVKPPALGIYAMMNGKPTDVLELTAPNRYVFHMANIKSTGVWTLGEHGQIVFQPDEGQAKIPVFRSMGGNMLATGGGDTWVLKH